ncbi:amidohydrolase family protein [Novosphingobium sp. PS1R-30]|uniref:Amidohydrolase family protein n=1 Tax=Novosphingobium anseongense TaxID=3133436 RepID=A0ABU8S0P0_9SPHN
MSALSRRDFIVAAGAAGGTMMVGTAGLAQQDDTPWRGEKIVDCHFHDRPTDAALIAHLDGAGISNGLVLAGVPSADRFAATAAKYPGRISGWAMSTVLAADGAQQQESVAGMARIPSPEAAINLRKAVRAGAKGFAETVGVVAVDGPELQRLYALAAELDVPVMMHFQESSVPNLPRYGIAGFSRIEAMLRAFPKTRFVCHASDFWGNIDSQFHDGGAYPTGKVNRGGLTEKLLADYPNMFGDLGAPSGLIQLARDSEFTSGFLDRHQDKLLFGSDCGCIDGRGGTLAAVGTSAMQTRMAAQGGLAGKCIARELLKIMWTGVERPTFRKLAWSNAQRVYKLDPG